LEQDLAEMILGPDEEDRMINRMKKRQASTLIELPFLVAIFKLNGKAHHFRAVIGVDAASQGDDSCRIKVRNLDPVGPTSLLYDSSKMTRDTAPGTVDVDVSGVDCLILECESDKALGNWAEAYVVVD
jgi:hypothetical protein